MTGAIIFVMLAVRASGAQDTSMGQEPHRVSIAVHLYNYAAIRAEDLRIVKKEVFRLLDHAGIEPDFADCPLSAADVERYPECKQGRRVMELVIRLRPSNPSRKLAKTAEVFGFAYIPEGGGLGTYADVYARGAEILARGFTSLEPLMLGHLVAHEIGHLLLGTSAHSAVGLMRSPWGALEKDRAAQGRLRFLEAEAKRMRANYRAYVRTQEAGNARCKKHEIDRSLGLARPHPELLKPI